MFWFLKNGPLWSLWIGPLGIRSWGDGIRLSWSVQSWSGR